MDILALKGCYIRFLYSHGEINVFCCNRTVLDRIHLDDSLEICNGGTKPSSRRSSWALLVHEYRWSVKKLLFASTIFTIMVPVLYFGL